MQPGQHNMLTLQIIEKIDVVGGYLNIFINKQLLAKTVLEEIAEKKENYGASNIGENKNIVLEYSSPNIAKPMHIGHLRNTVIGGALHKLYKFLGYNVTALNFLGDWGINFAKIIAGYNMWKDEPEVSLESLDSIFNIYVRYNELEVGADSISAHPNKYTDLARKWQIKLEDGDAEALKLWNIIRDISIKEAEKIYNLLNCKFDLYNGEAFYNDKMEDVILELKQKNLLVESEGAQIVDLEAFDMPPCIIITSAGTTLYATRDIASLKYRAETYNFDKAVYVVGSEQQLHFRQIFKVFELMGYEKYAKNCEHVYYGMILDSQGKKMASRKGTSLNLIELLNESVQKSKEVIEEKGTDIADKDKLAKQIGIGAIIFNSLYVAKIKDVIFDWDSILNFQGETGPYLQYTYVRTRSVLEKAGYTPEIKDVDFAKMQEPEEINTIKLLYKFSETIEAAAERNEPSVLARYLIDLAQDFSTFYNEHKILIEDKSIQDARLYLTYACGIVLKTGAELLGIDVPERM
ncbi:MAG: arginine--tRNA ligase [Firmicutes bacterium]|nr:arginine--tRNA ligase [Bacillota bacterium]